MTNYTATETHDPRLADPGHTSVLVYVHQTRTTGLHCEECQQYLGRYGGRWAEKQMAEAWAKHVAEPADTNTAGELVRIDQDDTIWRPLPDGRWSRPGFRPLSLAEVTRRYGTTRPFRLLPVPGPDEPVSTGTEWAVHWPGRKAPAADGDTPADDWPLPSAEIEEAEALGLVVRPESPAVQDGYPVHGMATPERPAADTTPAPTAPAGADHHFALTDQGRVLHIVAGLRSDTDVIGRAALCGLKMQRLVHPSDHLDGGRICRRCDALNAETTPAPAEPAGEEQQQ